ncbi:MAG: choice-of-anchor D domain-containing protein [Candidatus Eisenbacteria bacterium]
MPLCPMPRALARRSIAAALAALLALAGTVSPAGAVRIMNHNPLNWSGTSGVARVPYMLSILRNVQPDIVVLQEMQDQAGVNLYRDSVLNFLEPGQWVAGPFIEGPDTDSALLYKPSKWTFLDVVVVPTSLRNVYRYHMRLAGYTSAEAEAYFYVFHLKASTGFEAQRAYEMRLIRLDADALPVGSHVMFCGDYNVYTGTEPAFVKALQDTASNVGRMKDPINKVGSWHNSVALAITHTQSPRRLQFGGGATGGMDDRFDFILESYNLDDGVGMDLDKSTYHSYGNDGLHCCDAAINDPPTNAAIGQLNADSLMNASDHIPVVVDVIVPAKLGLSAPALAFGTVIIGAPASLPISLSNPAETPGDGLDYSMAVPAGFSGPSGPFAIPAGGTGSAHGISMDTATPGVRSGQLAISSDAPDTPLVNVPLSGTVVAHAQASLDSMEVAVLDTLDFGTQQAGGFNDLPALVWNRGYGALQAMLRVNTAAVTGDAAARFALVEPFSPVLLGAEAGSFDVHFDDTGLDADSTFQVTLTFTTADDPGLPGATAQANLSYLLLAHVTANTVGVEPAGPPTATVLYAPTPNPVRAGRLSLRFDLAQPGRATIALFDVRGRFVALLADGERPAGRHSVTWNGLDAGHRAVTNGVYFARLVTQHGAQTKRFLMLQ